ncbi:hypothetical protein Plhal304r1_c031g0100731 [Plasmopara halstedii]
MSYRSLLKRVIAEANLAVDRVCGGDYTLVFADALILFAIKAFDVIVIANLFADIEGS